MSGRLATIVSRVAMFMVPVAAGALLIGVVQSGRGAPERTPAAERVVAVRAIVAEPVPVRPRAVGFGSVQPGETWQAVTQVAGTVVAKHPLLATGQVVDEGHMLFEIDPTQYRLARARARAAVARAEAELAELDQGEANSRALLDIERRSLDLARREYERNRKLAEAGTLSRAALDDAESALNRARSSVRSLDNELALLPTRREVLAAELARQQAEIGLAKLDIERATVRAPFTGRIADEQVSVGQVLTVGQPVVTLDSVDTAEVEAEIPVNRMLTVWDAGSFEALGELSEARVAEAFANARIEASVRFESGDLEFRWPARFVRLRGGLDPVARTLGVVVAVDDPYAQARPGARPPLVKNMYVEVELVGPPRGPLVVVPREAVSEGTVLIADADDRLQRREVTLRFEQGGFAALGRGVESGERVVVSRVRPAIVGQKLAIEIDTETAARITAQASGEGSAR